MSIEGKDAYPSVEMVAKATGLSAKSAGAHLRKALAGGWIRRKRRSGPGTFVGYDYEIGPSFSSELPTHGQGRPKGNVIPLPRERRSSGPRNYVPTINNSINNKTIAADRSNDGFQSLWETFPRRPGSDPEFALKIWQNLSPMPRRRCLINAVAYRKDLEAKCKGASDQAALRYVPFLATWLKSQIAETE
jgi:hypothetical protein